MSSFRRRRALFLPMAMAAAVLSGAGGVLLGICGAFTDVSDVTFCPFVLEIFYLGITTGTTPTTYDPTSAVTRLQMAAFLSRTVDGVLKRGSRRAALNKTWTTEGNAGLALTTVGVSPEAGETVAADGQDIWVANFTSNTVARVQASNGKLLETWTGATGGFSILSAMGRIFVAGSSPGKLYRIDPSEPAGAVTTVATNLGSGPRGMTYDGSRIWTSNSGASVSIVTPGATAPFTVTTVTAGFGSLFGALYDGANVWVSNGNVPGTFLKLDSAGAILLTVTVGNLPANPVFDGSNIWVPNLNSSSVSVLRASNGAVLATLTGNGLQGPVTAAFDGQRILVTNGGNDTVSLWKAADLTAIGSFNTVAGGAPSGACSDGINFWIALRIPALLARF